MNHRAIALATAVAASVFGPPAAAKGALPLSFEGVELGTSEAAWRALKPPGPAPEHARRACSDDPGRAVAGLTPNGLAPGAVVCAVVDTYAATRPPVTFTWGRRYAVERLRFVFLGGRLSEISALLPGDAFDALMADLRRSYGSPSREVRDNIRAEIGRTPRVTETWVRPDGRVELVDPAVPGKLSLRLTAPNLAALR